MHKRLLQALPKYTAYIYLFPLYILFPYFADVYKTHHSAKSLLLQLIANKCCSPTFMRF